VPELRGACSCLRNPTFDLLLGAGGFSRYSGVSRMLLPNILSPDPRPMVSIQLGPEAEQRLRELASKQGLQADLLARNLLERCLVSEETRDARNAPCLPAGEADLLQAINRGLPAETWERYHKLMECRQDETLAPEEYAELVALTDIVEQAHAARMTCVAELARMRGVSIDDLMTELGIGPPANA